MKEQRANTKKKFKSYTELWFRPDEKDNDASFNKKIDEAIVVGQEIVSILRADKCYGDYTVRLGTHVRILIGIPVWMNDDEAAELIKIITACANELGYIIEANPTAEEKKKDAEEVQNDTDK